MERFLADPSLGYLRFVKEEWVHEVAMILGLAPLVEHVFGLYDLRPEWFRLSSADVFVLADDETSDFGQSLFIVAAGVYDGEVTFRELYDGKDVESSGGQVVSRYRIGIAADSRLSAHQGFESWVAANFPADEEPVVEVPVVEQREVADSEVSVQETAEAVCVEDPDLVCSMAGYCYLWAVKPEHRLAAMKELKADPVVGSVFSLDPGWIQGPLALAQVAALQVVSGWHWFRDPFGTLEPVQEDEVVSATVVGGDWQRLIRPEFRDLVVSEAGEDPTWGRFLQVPAEWLVTRLEAWACGLVYWDSSTWSKLKRVGSSMKVPWAGALAGGDRVGANPLFEFFRELAGFPVDERLAYEEGLSLLARGFDPGSKEHQELFARGHRAVWMTSYIVKIRAGDTHEHAVQYAQSQVDPNSLRMLTVRVGEVVAVGWKPGENITNASCTLMAMFGVACGLADISGVASMMCRLGRLGAEELRLLAGPWTGPNTTFRWAGRTVTVLVERPGGEVCTFGVKVD